MTTKKDLRDEVDQLKKQSDDNSIGLLYRHPETKDLYNQYKEPVKPDNYAVLLVRSWRYAPFVVEREKAEQEGWLIVDTVTVDIETDYYEDLVEVSEWCINPWMDNPDDRTVISR
jgi:hypothetical protein